jgi:6-pyruvoyltetrahydropterin/6-carboxytetrahydropterin synthase
MSVMQAFLTKILYAEAAHCNRMGNAAQQRLHGHSYRIEVLARGPVDPAPGWVVDYGDIKTLIGPVIAMLDHGYLNELPGFGEDTTLEGLRKWILGQINERPPWFAGVRVSITGDCCFRPAQLPPDGFRDLPARTGFTFEAAQSLPQLPPEHPCHAIHGHSYRVEVAGPEECRSETRLRAIYDALDHRYLNDIPDLEQATCERICRWIRKRLSAAGPGPSHVIVQETPAASCIDTGE